jgi:hypothetical protein
MTSSFVSGCVVPAGAGAGSGAFFSSGAGWVVPSVGAGGVWLVADCAAGAGGGVSVSARAENDDKQVNARNRQTVLFISGTSQLKIMT